MRSTNSKWVVAIGAALSISAAAQVQAEAVPRVRLLLPSLRLSVATGEGGKLTAGLPVMTSVGSANLILTPRLELASPGGVSTLLLGEGNAEWLAGASLAVVLSGSTSQGKNSDIRNKVKIALYNACIPECEKDPQCKAFQRSEPNKSDVSVEDLCKSSQEAWRQFERGAATAPDLMVALYDSCAVECGSGPCAYSLDAATSTKLAATNLCQSSQEIASRWRSEHPEVLGRFPKFRASVGAEAGSHEFTWLSGAQDAAAELVERTEPRSSLKAGLAVASVRTLPGALGLTLEVHGQYNSRWAASGSTARVCRTVGTVGGDAAQSCGETPLGAPSNRQILSVAADVGVVDRLDGRWRAAVGALWQSASGTRPARLALRFPIYLSFATEQAPSGYTGEYKGLLRVTPMLAFSRDPNLGIVPSAFISLEALGDVSMFPEALDYL